MAIAVTEPYEILQYNMIHAHATFKNGYVSILSRLDNPPMDDLVNFLGYCQTWADAIDAHHTIEEKLMFPVLNQKLDFSSEIEQHKAIHTAVDELIAVFRAAKADTTLFDPVKLKAMMMQLKQPLYSHLDAEVQHLAPAGLKVFEAHELVALMKKLEDHAQSDSDPFTVVPFMRSHTPPEWKDVWPGMPWFVRKILVPYVFAMRYRGYWKYAPYSV